MAELSDEHSALQGANVLIVDDEFLIALNLEYLLSEAGACVSVEHTLHGAIALAASERFSVALLDVRLGAETSQAVAAVLAQRGVPILFFSALPLPDDTRALFPDAPCLRKPLGIRDLLGVANELARPRAA